MMKRLCFILGMSWWGLGMLWGQNTPDSTRFEVIEDQIPVLIRSQPDSVRLLLEEQGRLIAHGDLYESTRTDFRVRWYNNWGIYHRLQSDLDQALHYYRLSNAAQDSAANPTRKAILYNNIANVHFQRGDYPLALDQHFHALSIREAIQDSAGMLMSQGNIGLVYENLGEAAEARTHYLQGLALAETLNDTNMLAWTFTSLGTLDLGAGKWETAEDYLRKSSRLKAHLGDQRGISFNLTNLGAVFLHRYQMATDNALGDSIEQYLGRAEALQLEMNNDFGLAATWNYLGEWYLATHRYRQAVETLRRADSLTAVRDHPQERVRSLELLSEAEAGRGNYAAALTWHQQFKELSDTLFNAERDREIGRKEAWLRYQQELREDQLQYTSQLALEAAGRDRQRLILVITALSLVLALLLIGRLYQKWRGARQDRDIAEAEREMLAQQNEELEGRIKEIQAKLEGAREELPAYMERLTKREMEVLLSLGKGLTDKEIAERLFISVATVRTHNRKIYEKLALKNRTEAVALLHRYQLT